jgi:hypothetical protein
MRVSEAERDNSCTLGAHVYALSVCFAVANFFCGLLGGRFLRVVAKNAGYARMELAWTFLRIVS